MEKIEERIQEIIETYLVFPYRKSFLDRLVRLVDEESSKAYLRGYKQALDDMPGGPIDENEITSLDNLK